MAGSDSTPSPRGRLRAYLAGPEVFLSNAKDIGERKKAICARYGLEGVFPLDVSPEPHESARDAALSIFQICLTMMEQCQLAVANLTPFRGVSMDVGTAVEIGYMSGSGKPVFGYTNVDEDYKTRVDAAELAGDAEVEDFGLVDNLMCEGIIRRSGEVIRRTVPKESRLTDLQGFENCVQQAVRILHTV